MSFVLKCEKCGNTANLSEAFNDSLRFNFIKSDNEELEFGGRPGEVWIKCKKCDNKITEEL